MYSLESAVFTTVKCTETFNILKMKDSKAIWSDKYTKEGLTGLSSPLHNWPYY